MQKISEKEAAEGLKNLFGEHELDLPGQDSLEVLHIAITALEEIQQYRAIGTVKECREALENQEKLKERIAEYEKLRKYEELEEQGLLLRLPCKVGDQFWEIDQTWLNPFIYPRKAHSLQHVVYCMERLGKTTFLTKEEAKAALERMKGEEHE